MLFVTLRRAPDKVSYSPTKNDISSITVYCDSDWVACAITRKSISSYCVKLGNNIVAWKSKKHDTISQSSVEAEYRSMGVAILRSGVDKRIVK